VPLFVVTALVNKRSEAKEAEPELDLREEAYLSSILNDATVQRQTPMMMNHDA